MKAAVGIWMVVSIAMALLVIALIIGITTGIINIHPLEIGG